MKKTGIVALILALLAFACGVMAFIPMTPLEKYSASFYGSINLYFGIGGAILAIVALIVSIVAKKKNAVKGAAIAGIIISIFAIIIGLVGMAFSAIMNVVTDYVNEKPGNALSQSLDAQQREELDKSLEQMFGSKK